MVKVPKIVFLLLLLGLPMVSFSQLFDKKWEDIVLNSNDDWFASPEAKAIAENVLLYQRNIGAWTKNIPMYKILTDKEKQELIAIKSSTEDCTTDNGATYLEMLFLSKINKQQPDQRYELAFLKGLDYLLESQYENGGFPQFYPLVKGYYTHITFNDNLMVNVLNILKEIGYETNYFSIKPPKETVEKAKKAYEKGIDCILNTQYKQNGELTAWCAQHDEVTLLPAKARAYELPSLSGKESAQIVLLLMSIENPSKKIITAVDKAVSWFEKTKIIGYKEEVTKNEKGKITEKTLQKEENAKPLWARFMELDDNTPFFCDRDGIKKKSYAEIGNERRVGYAWYTHEPNEVLKKYAKWKEKVAVSSANEKKKIDLDYLVVAQDGSGDFNNIQEAIQNAKSFPYQAITIFVKNGIYNEKVKINQWNTNLNLIGESKENTIVWFDDYFDKINLGRNSTFYTPTLAIEGDNCSVKNLTIKNTAGDIGQAIALAVSANRVLVENCNIIGNQDALYTSGENAKQYLKSCYIEGTTDFIFGGATVLFENCTLHSKKNSYITAASTGKGIEFGYVFKNCKLTANDTVTEVFLGRPWRKFAETVFLNCQMGKHIKPQAWDNWNNTEAETTSFFAEFQSTGEGANPNKRASWSHQLTPKQAKKYTPEAILGAEWYQSLINLQK